jgi:hypothetical protein
VTAIDPAANTIVGQPVQIGEDVGALAASPGGLWLTTYETGTVAFIDSESRAVVKRLSPHVHLAGVALARGSVSVSDHTAGRLARIDLNRARVPKRIAAAAGPRDIVRLSGALWVVDERSNAVRKIPLPRN